MSLTAGSRIGPYHILSTLGAGGMGEVYRGRDAKLNRDVAIKVLLPAVANDPDRLARFSREAQVLASLNHPNIAHIHGIEESNGITALVMELVEGEDLSQRIARGPIPIDEALPIARQIAEALEAAHEQGIIHRDLKPANIKVRADGTVKVLDFGLAKAVDPAAGSSPSAMNSPTISLHATEAGVILGTAAYMSPEQARGKSVDKRTDIWAFGCVLFEMLSGSRTFPGDDATDTMVAVLSKEPEWTALPHTVPAAITRLLRRCLDRERKRRLDSAAAIRFEIDEALTAPVAGADVTGVTGRGRLFERLLWLAAVSGVAVVAWLWPMRSAVAPVDAPMVRFSLSPPTLTPEAWNISVVSPDGRNVIFGGAFILGIGNQLWVRPLDLSDARALPGTAGAGAPFWSPDGRAIAFVTQGKLKKVDVAAGGNPPTNICDAPNQTSGAWNRDGTILFTSSSGGLARVPAAGGDPQPVTTLERGETAHRSPSFLPDGRHFLYAIQPSNTIAVGSLDSSDTVRLMEADSPALYAAPGYLLFMRGGVLLMQSFDAGQRRLAGEPMRISDRIGARASFSVSQNGVLVYRTSSTVVTRLAWFDRTGKSLGTLSEPAGYREFVLTRDGGEVAAERIDETNTRSVWQIDVARGLGTRLTLSADNDENMVWSPDGRELVFTSDGSEGVGLFHKSLGGGPVTTLLKSATRKWPEDWSSDGRYIVSVSGTHRQLEIQPMFGERKPFVFLDTPTFKDEPQFSPDVHWMAYLSDESGRYEVYVERFPESGDRVRVSSDGGGQPKWSRDGKELFYLGLDGTLMAVKMRDGRPTGLPSPLFRTRIVVQPLIHQYAVMPDGKRFLLIVPATETTASPFTVVMNWSSTLAQK